MSQEIQEFEEKRFNKYCGSKEIDVVVLGKKVCRHSTVIVAMLLLLYGGQQFPFRQRPDYRQHSTSTIMRQTLLS